MSVTQIILQKGKVLLTQTNTSSLGISFANSSFKNGIVVQVNDLNERFTVGDTVTYDPIGSTILDYGGDSYVLTTDDKVIYIEGIPL